MMLKIPWIAPDDGATPLPEVEHALTEPNGLLAVGGALTAERLVDAYGRGIFPWFSDDQPVLWWSPDPRSVIYPGKLRISRSLRQRLRRPSFDVTLDQSFAAVIRACAAPRDGQAGTWITPSMIAAYTELHELGLAHSVEVWREGALVGGLYGVSLGTAFFGESMFSRVSDASKVALVYLAAQLRGWSFSMIDCQMPTHHLETLGARTIPRREFIAALAENRGRRTMTGRWRLEPGLDPMIAAEARE